MGGVGGWKGGWDSVPVLDVVLDGWMLWFGVTEGKGCRFAKASYNSRGGCSRWIGRGELVLILSPAVILP